MCQVRRHRPAPLPHTAMSLQSPAIGLAIAVSALLQAACVTLPRVRTISATYSSALVEVGRPGEARARWGAVARIAPGDSNRYVYEDAMVRVRIAAGDESIRFAITNKTEHAITIIWDDARFIDTDGKVSKVMHVGTKHEDREQPQAPSVIGARQTVDDAAWPNDRVWRTAGHGYMVGKTYHRVSPRWAHFGLVSPEAATVEAKPDVPFTPDSAFVSRVRANVGKRMRLVLPLQIEGVTNEYAFWFEVTDTSLSTSRTWVR
jgi:hypothetical protein